MDFPAMTAAYRDILQRIRQSFPHPFSDRVHYSFFTHSIMRALDQVDALKSELPLLGKTTPVDYEAGRKAVLRDHPSTIEEVTAELVHYLEGMTLFGHPRTQQNVVPPSSIPSLIGVLLASMYNPNLTWDEYSRLVSLAEVETTAMTARLLGYDAEKAGGVFTFGGTGTTLYGVRIGLEKACPGVMRDGLHDDVAIFASDASHYCRYNIAGWMCLGTKRLVTIPTDDRNEINIELLGRQARTALKEGKRIGAFIATMGTTDAFGLDDLEAIVALRDQLVTGFSLCRTIPHVHADAVIGWAWSVFNDYDVEVNPLGFRRRTLRALAGATRRIRHLHLADSLGIDFHKTGFTPYISNLFLLKQRDDFRLISREPVRMRYLCRFGDYHPRMVTLETSRSGTGVLAALANLQTVRRRGHAGHARGTWWKWPQLAPRAPRRPRGDHRPQPRQLQDGHDLSRLSARMWTRFTSPGRSAPTPRSPTRCASTTTTTAASPSMFTPRRWRGEASFCRLTDCYRPTTYGEASLSNEIVHPVAVRGRGACEIVVREVRRRAIKSSSRSRSNDRPDSAIEAIRPSRSAVGPSAGGPGRSRIVRCSVWNARVVDDAFQFGEVGEESAFSRCGEGDARLGTGGRQGAVDLDQTGFVKNVKVPAEVAVGQRAQLFQLGEEQSLRLRGQGHEDAGAGLLVQDAVEAVVAEPARGIGRGNIAHGSISRKPEAESENAGRQQPDHAEQYADAPTRGRSGPLPRCSRSTPATRCQTATHPARRAEQIWQRRHRVPRPVEQQPTNRARRRRPNGKNAPDEETSANVTAAQPGEQARKHSVASPFASAGGRTRPRGRHNRG